MIRSMTGFGEASGDADGAHLAVEVRSLNGKYFKAVWRLPEELQGVEAELEPILRRRLSRGSIVLAVRCSDEGADAAYAVNAGALSSYLDALRAAPGVDAGAVTVDAAALLALPGVLQPPADDLERRARIAAALKDLTARACDAVLASRAAEGKVLAKELADLVRVIRDRLAVVAQRAPLVVDEYQDRLRARIDQLLADVEVNVDQTSLVREIAVYAEKTDITEEIARLGAHLDQFESLIGADAEAPVGRTLDFVSQEMLREANTMASKSNDAAISRAVVEIKGAIDRIKEQVQNVE